MNGMLVSWVSTIYNCRSNCIIGGGGQGCCTPPTAVAWVRFPDLASHVSWFLSGFSGLSSFYKKANAPNMNIRFQANSAVLLRVTWLTFK